MALVEKSKDTSQAQRLMVEFGDKKTILSPNTGVAVGSFALDQPPLKFEMCRERFARSFFLSTKGFYFKHKTGDSRNVATFVSKTERILNIRKRSKFSETNRDSILWFEPCYFWKSCRMRRSLLTILLRAGTLYDLETDNYEEALFKHPYLVSTKQAVMRFMYGFTKYVGPPMKPGLTLEVKGWREVFKKLKEYEIRKYLVSSRKKTHQIKCKLESSQLWL